MKFNIINNTIFILHSQLIKQIRRLHYIFKHKHLSRSTSSTVEGFAGAARGTC